MQGDRHRFFAGKRLALAGAAAAIALAGAAATFAWSTTSGPGSPSRELMLLYVGAEDCAPCRAWRSGDGAVFLAAADVSRLIYREVRSPHLNDVLKDENWPAELRAFRSRIKRGDGVPMWLLVADREVVEQEFGTTAWQTKILPKLRSYLR
jgi:hypothetical protein